MAIVTVLGEIQSTDRENNKVVDIVNVKDVQGRTLEERLQQLHSKAFKSIKKVEPYLYETNYDELDYDFAEAYFNRTPVALGGCSVVRRGNKVYRNLDWLDDYEATFVVRTNNVGRFASIGVAGSLPALTIQKVESGEYDEAYKALPFFMQDGVNEKGLFAEINVVPWNGSVSVTTPAVAKRERICAIALVRYILDKFEDIGDAMIYINNHVEVYVPQSLTDKGYEPHYMLCDKNGNAIVLEMQVGANGKASWAAISNDVSTNFHLSGVTFNADGSVNPVGSNPSGQGVELYGTGLERWNILKAGGSIKDVLFTKAYTNTENLWYSEFVGDELNVDSQPSEFADRIAEYKQKYAERTKENPETWLSVHSCEYDMEGLSVKVSVQEGDDEHLFNLADNDIEYAEQSDIDEMFNNQE